MAGLTEANFNAIPLAAAFSAAMREIVRIAELCVEFLVVEGGLPVLAAPRLVIRKQDR